MSIFKKLIKATVDTVLLPKDIVSDVLTLGGAITNEEAATLKRLKKTKKSLEDAYEELDED